MTANSPPSGAARAYAEAYASHYSACDLTRALQAYQQLIADHPGTAEAGYSRSQIRNIVRQIVPAGALLAALVQLARDHLPPDNT